MDIDQGLRINNGATSAESAYDPLAATTLNDEQAAIVQGVLVDHAAVLIGSVIEGNAVGRKPNIGYDFGGRRGETSNSDFGAILRQ